MGRIYDELDDHLIEWIGRQHLFFVASAPAGSDGLVNLSPKGYDTFRVIDPTTVAYLDLTGSGIETIAHVRENGRLTFMFCSFDAKPNILRLWGRGDVIVPGDADWLGLASQFPEIPGARAVVRCRLERISSSCGYSIPIMTYEGERATLTEGAVRRGPHGVAAYCAENNQVSLDGLPGLPGLPVMSDQAEAADLGVDRSDAE